MRALKFYIGVASDINIIEWIFDFIVIDGVAACGE